MTMGGHLVLLLRRISPRPMTMMTRVRASMPKQQRDPFPVFLCRARLNLIRICVLHSSFLQDGTKMPHAVSLLLSEYSRLIQSQGGLRACIRFLPDDRKCTFAHTISLAGQ